MQSPSPDALPEETSATCRPERNRILLRCNESVTLRVGDKVGVAHLVWMQVVLALCVRQLCGEGTGFGAAGRRQRCSVLLCLSDTVPSVTGSASAPGGARKCGVDEVTFRHQGCVGNLCVGAAVGGGLGCRRNSSLDEFETQNFCCFARSWDGMEEAAAISNSSQVIQEGGTITTSSETRSKRRLHASLLEAKALNHN
ncbi:hypothetical protein TcBrA4_0064740 [Trypanosoma cruzi]|nr:hypothetical protein TcBrA4_0064740 [Trypanosoma cruzi]